MMLRKYIITMLMFFLACTLNAQTNIEKVYTQTDRPFYFPGETMWFKSYIVRADNTISTINDVVYAELISPNGSVVKKIKLPIKLGYAYGDFILEKDWVGGIYKLKIYTNWMKNFGDKSYFIKKITVQKVVKPNALLTLKFEKEGYGKASGVIANFKAEDLKNNPIRNKEFKYIVSVKGKQIINKTNLTDSKGKAIVKFTLPANLSTRDVVLNVQISSRGTIEAISKSVPITLDNIDLQFFAESGKLLQGIVNKVGFKAINEFGKPVDVEGSIIDENGIQVSNFKSFHDGMGAFSFSPLSTKKYFAQMKVPFVSNKKIALPKVYKEGVHFEVTSEGKKLKIKLHSTLKKTLKLKITNSYKTLKEILIPKNKKEIIVDTRKFSTGITKFTLVDKSEKPLAERLFFVNPHKQLKVSIKLEKEYYKTREKVNAILTTTNEKDEPISANLSVAVADNKLLTFVDDKQDHILSSLLLSSELKGKIYKPSFYFNSKEEKSYKTLDYVMLTHGWRDYVYKPISIKAAKFQPEKVSIQTGVVCDKNNKPVKAKLILFDNNHKYRGKVKEFETDEKGRFALKHDETFDYVLFAYNNDGKKLRIVADNIFESNEKKKPSRKEIQEKKLKTRMLPQKNKAKTSINKLKKEVSNSDNEEQAEDIGYISMETGGDSLDMVVVSGYGTKKSNLLTTASATIVSSEEFSKVNNTDVAQSLQGRVSGVKILGESPGSATTISIRGTSSISGSNEPLYVIDGVPSKFGDLNKITPSNIESIQVLKDAAATSLYGSRAVNGVVIITSKGYSWGNNNYKKKIKKRRYKNYAFARFVNSTDNNLYRTKKFYAPKYSYEDEYEIRNDFRQTIYWNPLVLTDANGKAKVSFYNSEATTSFKIVTEGIGYNGLVGRQEKKYATKKALSVDIKTPNYMAVNDTIHIPVTLTNGTSKDLFIKSYLYVPSSVAKQKKPNGFDTIKANSSIVKYFTIIPKEKSKEGEFWLTVRSKDRTIYESIRKKVTIISPYFPKTVSISGIKSKAYKFKVADVVEGTLKSDFKIYTDVIGDVMDGVEGIIRQPSGCFEQVSSSTYPNILVLKYLRETNKSNPEIEQKAMDFIKSGYERLAGYETAKNGFEWYGKTPPHEALSAYGLMEFTEMKEVYNKVSEPMLKRTIDFLLSRKDGKGGFKQNKGKYGFSAAPNNVNNAYIVYAIAESGIKVNIENEYNSTFKESLESNDTYRMALLACASYSLGKNDNYSLLMAKIEQNITEKGFAKLPVEHTITRSYGNAKKIETTAFTVLAMLKQYDKYPVKIYKGVEYLVSKRNHGRFGSTQSTSMALKALIEFTKTQKNIMSGDVDLILNNKKITKSLSKAKGGKLSFEDLTSYLKKGNQEMLVKFQNPKSSYPYSFNITYDSYIPESSEKSPLLLDLSILDKRYEVGDNVSLNVKISNKENKNLGMVTAIIGFPSGTTPQPWQLKKLTEENQVAYYEIFDNYLVFYWREFGAKEQKTIRLDLKADISGSYQAPASAAYLYYGDEFKTWVKGNKLKINK